MTKFFVAYPDGMVLSRGDGLLIRHFRRRVFLLATVWVLTLLAVLSVLSLLDGAFSSDPNSHTIVSVGWAGYVVSSSFNERQAVVGISGSWTVPKVNVSAGSGYSSAWVGIGGQVEKTLIQVGTEHNVLNGREVYGAWYEMLPDYSIRIQNFTVMPGHVIEASITLLDVNSNLWNIQLSDLTNGKSFSQNFVYNSTRSSGEWIVERSTVNGQVSPLPDFGLVTFSNCEIDVSNEKGTISSFTYSTVQMTNQQYGRLATASTLTSDGSGFNVSYQSNN